MLKFLSIKLIRFYQKYISKKMCPFTPSCSEYTIEAIAKYGFFYGWFLGIKRIFKCNPWTKGGFDKVPDKKNDIKWII